VERKKRRAMVGRGIGGTRWGEKMEGQGGERKRRDRVGREKRGTGQGRERNRRDTVETEIEGTGLGEE
jgi:hypothetical protein